MLAHAPTQSTDFDVGYSPEFAREQFAAAGYADCAEFPAITLRVFEGAVPWAEFLAQAAVETLGCEAGLFDIQELRLNDLQTLIQPTMPAAERPHIFTSGWGADYPDADSFMGLLACGVNNVFLRECSDTDGLIEQARSAADPEQRTALYRQIEAAFFGRTGEFPLIPLYLNSTYRLRQPWVSGAYLTDGQFGGLHFDAYTLDLAAVAQVRIECNIVGLGSANLRAGPATTFELVGKIQQNDVVPAVAQTAGRDGFVWWLLVTNEWIREDVVREQGDCERLPDAFAEPE
jgi:hypothetical protein